MTDVFNNYLICNDTVKLFVHIIILFYSRLKKCYFQVTSNKLILFDITISKRTKIWQVYHLQFS